MDGWEELDIDESDLITAHETHFRRPPSPRPSNILPAKRPIHSQVSPTTDGILNRFKKQNNTQTLADPTLSNPRALQQSQPPQRSNSQPRVCRPNNENQEAAAEGGVEFKRVLIPGPAGAVQRALHKKVQADGKGFRDDRTFGIASSASSRQEDDDADFKEAAWLSAMNYLHRESVGCSESMFSVKPTIGFIKKKGNIDRIPQVLGIIKTCAPNKLGSMFVTLKDPTGTISGSIHHRVMRESEFGRDISVGAVLLLRQVAVFSPTPWAHYLNISLTNVEKVFKKGSCLPERQDGASTSNKRSNLPPDVCMEVGISTDRASQQDDLFSPRKHEETNHTLHSRLIDENVIATQNAGFHQHHHFTIDTNLEGRKALPREDNSQQRLTHENITPTKITNNKSNALKVMCSEEEPQAGTNGASENVGVCCNKKESIPVTIDWNEAIELLMADDLDLFD